MIVCTNCGNHNEDSDEFCGSCGKFLEWVGQRIETPAPAPEVQTAPEPEPVKAGLIERVKAVVGIEEGAHASAASGGAAVAGSPGVARAGAPPSGDGGSVNQAEEERRLAEEEERAHQEAEAARRAQEEAEAAAAARAEAARRAEEEARRRAEDEARAHADAEERRQAEAEATRRAEQERRAVEEAEAEAAAAAASARQAELEAQTQAADAAAQAAAEAEAARQADQAAAAAAALEEAKRAEERARVAAEAEARALQEAQLKERQEAEARRAAEEEARREAAEEARAKAAAEARAREEEAARKRAAALLQRARPAPTAVPDEPPAPAGPAPATAARTPAAPVRPPAQQPMAQQPVAQQPLAQQPSSTKTPPRPDPKVKAAEKVLKPGDLVCGQCGVGNDPTRRFCRKCGNSLAQAAPAKKIPWWKKLLAGKSRVSKEAGAKGSKVRAAKEASFKVQIFLNTLRRVLMVLAFLGVAGSFAVPSARTLVFDKGRAGAKAVQNLLNPQFEPVNAVAVSASSAIEGHGANFANDLGSNTYWAEGAEGEGIGQTISFTFENKVDLTKVIVSSGAADSPDNFLKQPRPKRLHLVFDNGGSADIVLKDQFKPQGFGLKGAKGVSKVDIAIVEVYKGQSGSDTAIAEVEFKKKG